MSAPAKKVTLEYSQEGNTVVIVTRRPGKPPVRIVADTVSPQTTAPSEPKEKSKTSDAS